MRRLSFACATLLLAACHSAKPLPPLAEAGTPFAEPAALADLDGGEIQAMWRDSYGTLALPADPLPALKALYSHDLLANLPVEASSVRGDGKLPEFAPAALTDGNPRTFWAAAPDAREAVLSVNLPEAQVVSHVWLEGAPDLGARVRDFAVDAKVAGRWQQVAQGDGIGARKVLRFAPVLAQALRLRIKEAADAPALRRMSAYAGPVLIEVDPEKTDFIGSTQVRMRTLLPGMAEIHYTLDGTFPVMDSPVYDPRHPPRVSHSCQVRAGSFVGGRNIYRLYALPPASAQLSAWSEAQMQPAAKLALAPERGLAYAAYAGVVSLAKMEKMDPSSAGLCETLAVKPRPEDGALLCEGWLWAPEDGLYTLTLQGTAKVWLDGQPALETAADAQDKKVVAWRKGWHPLRAAYWVGRAIDLKCFGPGCPDDGKIAPERFGR